MQDQPYSTRFHFDKTPDEVFDAINNVRAWWSEDFHGASRELNDIFDVRFDNMHLSTQQIVEITHAKKIAWHVTASHLSFLKTTDEWTGTRIVFELEPADSGAALRFTHIGLVPAIECFEDCTKGWNYYLQQSLVPYINTGKGKPHIPVQEIVHQ